jgi:uncharacterized repeat protein (TIGR03803 family)
MQSEKQLTTWTHRLAILAIVLALAPAGWAGSKYKVLYNFKGGNDGIDPHGNLVFDSAGNLYGTTAQGGGTTACDGQYQGCGIVFQLEPRSSGPWKENVLYSFTDGSTGGVGLEGNLVLDAAGDIYGTAYYGGSDFEGTVFELTPGSGGWTEKTIYAFCPSGCGDGASPASGVIFDNAGSLYGTATAGGTDGGGGVIFKLTPSNGNWTESVLYSFCPAYSCGSGGWYPWGLTKTANGAFYGSTVYGGNYFWPCVPGDGCGAVFKFNPKSGDYVALHRFDGRDGAFPNSGVVLDNQGNIYGTTTSDGAFGCGTVFELSPKTGGGWTYDVRYNLRARASAGSLAIDSAGNLYVATSGITGGTCQNQANGEISKLTPKAQGHWQFSTIHSFPSGAQPSSGLIFDSQGNLYGTAATGGANGYGFVFEITP